MLPKRIPKPAKRASRWRSPAHRAWVRSHQCSVPGCQLMPIECAHFRSGTGGGMGFKPGDEWCWSACRDHHAEQHEIGEQSFQKKYGMDLRQLSNEFTCKSPHAHKFFAFERTANG